MFWRKSRGRKDGFMWKVSLFVGEISTILVKCVVLGVVIAEKEGYRGKYWSLLAAISSLLEISVLNGCLQFFSWKLIAFYVFLIREIDSKLAKLHENSNFPHSPHIFTKKTGIYEVNY